MSTRINTALRNLMVVFFCAAVCFQPGCKPKQDARSDNGGFKFTHAHDVLQTELDRLGELPIEYDPAKRPLILSLQAANRRQWAFQTLQQGYRTTGRTNALWDAQVHGAFGAFSDYTRISTTNWPTLKKALAAVATGCDDPMIQYMRVHYRNEVQHAEKKASDYLQAHDALVRSEYHPVFKFMAGLRAVQSARTAHKATRRSNRISWTTVNLEDLARDTNAPVDEVFDAASLWLEHSNTNTWLDYVLEDLGPILERNWGQTERWFRLHGKLEIRRAWNDRGGGYAYKVTDEGWQGFSEHLGKAEEFLTKAWQMNSNSAETAYLMMRVELGQGRGLSRMETWFNRAMLLETDYYDAASLMSFYLEPRWYGSEAEALAFARSCVTSDQWGGTVPLVLPKLHRSLARYYEGTNSPAYWRQPHVWRDVDSAYTKFFKLCPDEAGWRHDFARDAYACGQYSVFLEQTKLFAYGTNHAFFGGPEKFQEMIEKAGESSRVPSPK